MPAYTAMDDEVLFSLMKLEEAGAFREIYERYFDGLYIHAWRKLQHKEEARDVVQEIFATLWDKRDRISLNSSLAAYLYTSVRNRILNIMSHKQVESAYVQSLQNFIEDSICQTDHLVRGNQLHSMIEKEMAALPSGMQKIFELSRREHLSHREIAAQLNISEETVKKQVNNALRILRSKLSMEMN
jgi:RNA polymerase sigma-70 factor (ECF subfamily)